MGKILSRIIKSTASQTFISELVGVRVGYNQSDYPWAKKMLGKFPLPQWQRDSVWTDKQKVSLIESAYYGFDLGAIVINTYDHDKKGNLIPFSDCLIDGQQRIGAMLDYINSKFKVNGYYFNELSRQEQGSFMMRDIGLHKISCFEEEKLKMLYNHLNFSGTNHKESERA
ncbi:DUF262 domain-containing protein [Vibrio parahaemolyticus]|uniref:DUF262 domain-containing protein n=1 Tax=Vibrio parahaemolyticus TaxID=670 RepID=UPI00226AAF68|nr:DUF262 domain-containing protein [Vibrio parahaemolyticus]MCX8795868.1 DUF262 domain-containing protein [Vibrio parahaemolyticus]